MAIDSGPAVVSRKAARVTGRTVAQRNAVVIDRFFESRAAALAWERSHPHFMTVRVVPAGTQDDSKESPPEVAKNQTPIAAPEMKHFEAPVDANEAALSRPNDSLMHAGRRRTL